MMLADPTVRLLRPTLRQYNVFFVDVIEGNKPKTGNTDRPNSHTPWTQSVNTVHAFKKEPVHKPDSKEEPGIKTKPKPTFEARPCQNCRAYYSYNRKSAEPDKRIGNVAKGSGLLALHNASATYNWVKIA